MARALERLGAKHGERVTCSRRGDRHTSSQWDERPLPLVLRDDASEVSEAEIRNFLSNEVAKWWLPDAIEFVEDLPHTATGKLSKKDLRDNCRDYRFANAEAKAGRNLPTIFASRFK